MFMCDEIVELQAGWWTDQGALLKFHTASRAGLLSSPQVDAASTASRASGLGWPELQLPSGLVARAGGQFVRSSAF